MAAKTGQGTVGGSFFVFATGHVTPPTPGKVQYFPLAVRVSTS